MVNNISVLGSINLDTTYHVTRIPLPGETIHVAKKTIAAGGKGANQAVAARRSGAKVSFIGAVGNDSAGKYMLQTLEKEKIDSENIIQKKEGTGEATVLLDEKGQNSILVYSGANDAIDNKQIERAKSTITKSDFIISQFETPISATLKAFKLAKENSVITVLNPAPAKKINDELLKVTEIIAPNETESELITGIKVDDQESMIKTAEYFKKKGVQITLITLGSKGVFYSNGSLSQLIPAHKVRAIDTTGAGDTFIGAMASKLKSDFSNIALAINYGQQASSITVQGLGAQPSIPTKEEIEKQYGKEE